MIARVDSVFLLNSGDEIDKKIEAGKAAADIDMRSNNNESEMII